MKRLIIIGFLVCWANVSFSQLKSYVLRNSLKIGEQTELIYEIKGNGEQPSLSFPAKSGTIVCEDANHPLEIIGVFNDTVIQQQDTWTWRGTYVVTAWDSGKYVVPSFSISIGKKVETFEKVVLNVTFPKVDKNGQIKDIKSIFTDIPSEFQSWLKQNSTWILWGIVVLGIALILWFWVKRRKKKIPTESKKQQTYAEIAIQEIDTLIAQKYWVEHGEKEYYFKLSTILKSYLGANYQLSLNEKTSYEIQLLLNQLKVNRTVLLDIEWVLQQSDMVKFAKSEPSELDMLQVGTRSKSIVEETYSNHR
jgi:LPXTG-motif cell wall-anchored protein